MNCVTGAKRGVTACVILMTFGVALFASTTASRAQEHAPYIGIGAVTTAPIGWAEFCVEYAPECDTGPSPPRDVVLSARAWTELKRINIGVNTNIKPMTDMPCSRSKPTAASTSSTIRPTRSCSGRTPATAS